MRTRLGFLRFLGAVGLSAWLGRKGLIEAAGEDIATSPNKLWYYLGPDPLIASGGLCAPLEPIYDLPSFARPIHDALPAFTTIRGAIETS